jgi:hypothetical protein
MQPNYAPPQQYPQQFPQYPPQGFPQQQFAPSGVPGYPPVQMAPPPPPLAQGSIDDFYSQPVTGGGAFWKFEGPGVYHAGFVARAIAQGDIRQQTTPPAQGSVPQTYRDGRPKFEMLVPLKVQPDQVHLDGLATWAVRGNDREELTRAMAEAGAPEGPPEAGAFIQVVCTELRPTRGGIPQKVKQVQYTRPGETPALFQPAVQQPTQPVYAQPQQVQQLPPGQAFVSTGAPQTAVPGQPLPPAQGSVQQVPQAPAVPYQPTQVASPPAQATAPAQPAVPAAPTPADGLSEAQQELLARLTAGKG